MYDVGQCALLVKLGFAESPVLQVFIKEANLSPEEAAMFKELLKQRNAYEQQTRHGISDELRQAMLHNQERLKHYQQRKRDANYAIPGWVKDPNAKPPPVGGAGRAASSVNEAEYWKQRRAAESRAYADNMYGGGRAARNAKNMNWDKFNKDLNLMNGASYGTLLGSGASSILNYMGETTPKKERGAVLNFAHDNPMTTSLVGIGAGGLGGYGAASLYNKLKYAK